MTGRPLRILAASTDLPRPDVSAGDRRLFEILALLARRHEVDLHTLVAARGPRPGEAVDLEGIERQLAAYRGAGVRVLEGGPGRSLDRIASRRRYDVGIFMFWEFAEWAAESFRRRQPWARTIIDTVDVHFLREEAALALGASASDAAGVEARKQRELATYRRADALIAITSEDRAALEAQGEMPPQYLIPILVPSRPRDDRPRGPEALFVGGFRHAPNVDGLLWFAGEVWPEVRRRVSGATLTVVGSHPSPEVEALDGVEGIRVAGYVPETGPYLDRAALSVAPLRYGAGMKGKVVEAMAAGLAVVTTTAGAQGLDAVSGRHLIVADEPGEFARHVAELLADPARAETIGRAARDHVGAFCSPEAADARLEEMLSEVVGRGRPAIPHPRWLARSAWELIRRVGGA